MDDGESLDSFADGSQDFVVANHFIEHTQDPIGALGATSACSARRHPLCGDPRQARTFDAKRPVTTIEHLERDHREGPAWSRAGHFLEWAELVSARPSPSGRRARRAELRDATTTRSTSTSGPRRCSPSWSTTARHEEGIPLGLEAVVPVRHEFITVLRKR